MTVQGSVVAALARDSPMIVLAYYVVVDVALGFIVASRSRLTGIAALAMTLGALPGYAIIRIAVAGRLRRRGGGPARRSRR